jgi:hypothetical protein
MRRLLVTVTVLFALPSCYITEGVRGQDLRALGHRLADRARVRTTAGASLGFDAQASVRVGISDTGQSDWIGAGHLYVTDDALFLEAPIDTADIAAAIANNLDDGEVVLLRQMAPPGGQCVAEAGATGHAFRLTATPASTLLPWIEAFVIARRQAGAALGTWWVETREPVLLWGKRVRTAWLLFDRLGPRPAGRLVLAYGAPWGELTRIQVNHLDPVISALTIPAFPLLLLLRPRNNGREETAWGVADFPKRIWPDADPQPLFSPSGRRRAVVKLVAETGGGVTNAKDWFADGSLRLRFLDFFEVGGLIREVSLASDGKHPQRQSTPLVGLAAGLHIDGDGDPRFAFYLGFEFLGGRGGAQMLSLVLAPRIGLGRGVFVAVPVGATSVCHDDPQGACADHGASYFGGLRVGMAY